MATRQETTLAMACERLRKQMGHPRAVATRLALEEYRRLGCKGPVSLKGFGAVTTSKADANSAYEATKVVRLEAEATLKTYASSIPEGVKQAFYDIDKWFWPNYEQFIQADEFSYGNWKEAALNAADQYRAVANQFADAILKATGKPPEKPGDKPKDNTMLIVGGVVAASVLVLALVLSNRSR